MAGDFSIIKPFSNISSSLKTLLAQIYPNVNWDSNEYFALLSDIDDYWNSSYMKLFNDDGNGTIKVSIDEWRKYSGLYSPDFTSDYWSENTLNYNFWNYSEINLTLIKKFSDFRKKIQEYIDSRDADLAAHPTTTATYKVYQLQDGNVNYRPYNNNPSYTGNLRKVGWPISQFNEGMTYEQLMNLFNAESEKWYVTDITGGTSQFRKDDGTFLNNNSDTAEIHSLLFKGTVSLSETITEDVFFDITNRWFMSGYLRFGWNYKIPEIIFNRNDIKFFYFENGLILPDGRINQGTDKVIAVFKKSYVDYILNFINLPREIYFDDEILPPDPGPGPDPGPEPENFDCPTFWLGDGAVGKFPNYTSQEFWAGTTDSFIGMYSLTATDAYNLGKSVNSILSNVTSLLPGMPTPQETILSFRCVPYQPKLRENGRTIIMLGRYGTTNTEADLIQLQYEPIDGGVVYIPPKYNSFLDYSPYTKIMLHIPFYGVVPLDADIVMGRYIQIVYFIDNVTGAYKCFLAVYNEDPKTNPDQLDYKVLTTLEGSVGATVPLIYQDFSDMFSNMTGLFFKQAVNFGDATNPAGENVMSDVGNMLNTKTPIVPISNTSPNGSYYDCRIAFVEIHRPNECRPETYAHDVGIPCNVSLPLNELTGFTKISKIHLDGLTCTNDERDELLAQLTNGVIL